jgi:hypothetical protein
MAPPFADDLGVALSLRRNPRPLDKNAADRQDLAAASAGQVIW